MESSTHVVLGYCRTTQSSLRTYLPLTGRALTTAHRRSTAERWQGTGGKQPGRRAAGGARQAHGPRDSVRGPALSPPIGGPVGAALSRASGGGCAADVRRTSSAARSAAGSARWRSSRFCKRRSAHSGWGARCEGTTAGYSKQRMIRCGCRIEPSPLFRRPSSPPHPTYLPPPCASLPRHATS